MMGLLSLKNSNLNRGIFWVFFTYIFEMRLTLLNECTKAYNKK